MKQVNARRIAYEAIRNILGKGQYTNLALKEAFTNDIPILDRSFITQLVYGTIEHLITIDYIISIYAKKSIKPAIKDILRLGVYQVYYLNVPDSAACNESVKLAKEIGKEGTSSFINAILRNISREKDKIIFADKKDIVNYLSIVYSYPIHIVKRLLDDYGSKTAEEIMKYTAENYLSIRPTVTKISKEELCNSLEKMGIEILPGALSKEAILIKNSNMISSDLYKEGLFSIQSESSMLSAQAVCSAAQNIEKPLILDACAAPGGKTFYIKEHLKNAKITAWDLHEHRVKLIVSGIKRLGLSDIAVKTQDACELVKDYINKYDIVLIDAPCSGLGVVASKPDIKYNLTEEDLAQIESLQKNILNTCSNYVKPGGKLIYSTCTILKNENERMIDSFLTENDSFEKIDVGTLIDIEEKHKAFGYAQLLNINTGREGFFIAGLVKRT